MRGQLAGGTLPEVNPRFAKALLAGENRVLDIQFAFSRRKYLAAKHCLKHPGICVAHGSNEKAKGAKKAERVERGGAFWRFPSRLQKLVLRHVAGGAGGSCAGEGRL